MLPLIDYSYSIPYLVLVVLVLVWGGVGSQLKMPKLGMWGMGVILLFFFGLRGFVFTDWHLYYWAFKKFPSLEYSGFYFHEYFEYGYSVYTQIFKTLVPNYFVWVFLNTAIDIGVFMYIFRRYSRSYALSWALFIAFSGLIIEINLFRNVKAILLFLLAIPYLQRREMWKYMGMIALACLFHISALMYVPCYFFLHRRLNRIVPVAIFVVVNVVFFFKLYPTSYLVQYLPGADTGLMRKAVDYYVNADNMQGISFGYIERFITFWMIFTFSGKLAKKNPANIIFCNAYYIFYSLWYLFSDVQVFVERFPLLFAFSYWIAWPNIIAACRGERHRALQVAVVMLILFKVATFTNNIVSRYDNLVTGISDIRERTADKKRFESMQNN